MDQDLGGTSLPTLRDLHAALATVLRAQERPDEARREEAAARKIDERLAATIPDGELRQEFRRRAGLVNNGNAATRGKPNAAPGGLTTREREVAGYIVVGRSNREIAEALFVSERTVEAHVANILRKLGASSRAAIAASGRAAGNHPRHHVSTGSARGARSPYLAHPKSVVSAIVAALARWQDDRR